MSRRSDPLGFQRCDPLLHLLQRQSGDETAAVDDLGFYFIIIQRHKIPKRVHAQVLQLLLSFRPAPALDARHERDTAGIDHDARRPLLSGNEQCVSTLDVVHTTNIAAVGAGTKNRHPARVHCGQHPGTHGARSHFRLSARSRLETAIDEACPGVQLLVRCEHLSVPLSLPNLRRERSETPPPPLRAEAGCALQAVRGIVIADALFIYTGSVIVKMVYVLRLV